ncbi:MAG: Naphthalene 1,2-dioxygenase system ferredoxin subunit [Pseudomonadota bacterium]
MSNWIDVAAEADLFEGAGIAVTPLNFDIAIFKVDDGVFAINNECSHGNAKRWLHCMRPSHRTCQSMARQN